MRDTGTCGSVPVRRILVFLAVGVPLSGVFLYLAIRGAHPSRVADALSHARWAYVAGSVVALMAIYLLQAARWRIATRAALPIGCHVATVFAATAANNVLPGRLGDLLRVRWLARDAAMPGGRALATVIVDRAADVCVLVCMLAVLLPLMTRSGWIYRLAIAGTIIAAGLAVAVSLVRAYAKRRSRDRAVERGRVRRVARDTADGLSQALDARSAMQMLLLTTAAWLSFALAAWLVARSLDVSLSVKESLFVTAAMNLGVSVPSSPGFVGAYQWFAVASFSLFDIDRESALAFSILVQAGWYVPTTIVGGIVLVRRAFMLRTVRGRDGLNPTRSS